MNAAILIGAAGAALLLLGGKKKTSEKTGTTGSTSQAKSAPGDFAKSVLAKCGAEPFTQAEYENIERMLQSGELVTPAGQGYIAELETVYKKPVAAKCLRDISAIGQSTGTSLFF